MSDKMREEFEENYRAVGWRKFDRMPENHHRAGDYRDTHLHASWVAWQASRAALVVELPPSMGMPDEDELDYEEFEAMEAITCTANGMRHACRNAIHASGVKTR